MSRPEAAFMWPSAAAWVSGLRLALFGHRPLAEHMREELRRVTRRVSALADAGEPHFRELEPAGHVDAAGGLVAAGGLTLGASSL